MVPRRQKNNWLALAVKWATDPANRRTVVTLLGFLVAFLGGGAARDLASVIPVTRAQLDSAKVEFVEAATLNSALAASSALRRYDDSLRTVAQNLTDSVAVPMIEALTDLSKRVKRIEKLQGITVQRIAEIPSPDNASIAELRRQIQSLAYRDQYGTELKKIVALLDAQDKRLKSIEERVNKKQKIVF